MSEVEKCFNTHVHEIQQKDTAIEQMMVFNRSDLRITKGLVEYSCIHFVMFTLQMFKTLGQ